MTPSRNADDPALAPTRRTPPDEVRAAIVAATIRILGTGGVAAVTHRAVADEAGVSLSSTTYHFASKTDIIDAALREVADAEIGRVEETSVATVEVVHDVESLVAATTAWFVDQLEGDEVLIRAGYELQLEAVRRPELQQLHAEWGLAVQGLMRDVLARAGSPTPKEDAHIIAALVDGLRLEELSRPRPGVAKRAKPLFDRLIRALIPA